MTKGMFMKIVVRILVALAVVAWGIQAVLLFIYDSGRDPWGLVAAALIAEAYLLWVVLCVALVCARWCRPAPANRDWIVDFVQLLVGSVTFAFLYHMLFHGLPRDFTLKGVNRDVVLLASLVLPSSTLALVVSRAFSDTPHRLRVGGICLAVTLGCASTTVPHVIRLSTPPYTVRVTGVVIDGDRPLEHATVALLPPELTQPSHHAITDVDGQFHMTSQIFGLFGEETHLGVPPGAYEIRVLRKHPRGYSDEATLPGKPVVHVVTTPIDLRLEVEHWQP